ncbi:MAG: methyl-accepting chemotaxis protein [Planctomycetes bacterium]|nr:methyl-accepting chemotaxis protein [Planctomycetota bacterium]
MKIRFRHSLLGQFILYGVLPFLLISLAVVVINRSRLETLLGQLSEEEALVDAEMIAANYESRNQATVMTAQTMASAAERGLFGKREESLEFARQVMENSSRVNGCWFCYEPNADGKDASYAGAVRANIELPSAALDPKGRFIPYWYRDLQQGGKISLKSLNEFENMWNQGPLRNWRDHKSRAPTITEPYTYEGVMMTECTVPIVIDGKFAGNAGVDRSLIQIESYLQTLATRTGNNIFMVSAGGKFIAAVAPLDGQGRAIADLSQLKTQEVASTPWGPVLAPLLKGSDSATAWLEDPIAKSQTVFATAKIPTGGWTVLVEIPAGEIQGRIFNFAMVSGSIAVASIVLVTILLVRLAMRLAGRIRKGVQAASIVAQGDLSRSFADPSNLDESGKLLQTMDEMGQRLAGLVGKVREATIAITGTANQMTAASHQQDEVAQSFGASSSEIAAAIRQISTTGAELFRTMEGVSASAKESSRLANEGRTDLKSMGVTMDALAKATGEISGRLAAINDKASNINAIVVAITKVADQTNLLSVNAAIEAEKAGESGKGFLVVAREIRRLADQTASATLDIERTVEQMQTAVSGGVMEMDRFADQVRRGVGQVSSIGQRLAGVIQGVGEIGGQFGEVTTGMQSQVQGAEQIRQSMDGLSQNASRARDATKEFSEAAQSLILSISVLREAVAIFKLADQARKNQV